MGITVLIVDDEENARRFIGDFLSSKGYEVIGAATLGEAKMHLNRGDGDVVLLDVQLPDGYGPNLLYETGTLRCARRSS
jgi:DNA-binding response OmpR family regulator